MLSLPRLLTIRNGQLNMEPLPALQQLRRASLGGLVSEYAATLTNNPAETPFAKQNGPQPLPLSPRDTAGPLLNLVTSTGPELLLTSPDSPSVHLDLDRLPTRPELRVFFDNSVLELFLGGQCFTQRFYRRSPETAILTLHLPQSLLPTHSSSWSLRPIWPA